MLVAMGTRKRMQKSFVFRLWNLATLYVGTEHQLNFFLGAIICRPIAAGNWTPARRRQVTRC